MASSVRFTTASTKTVPYPPLAGKLVRQPVQAVADNTLDTPDTCCSEGFRKLVSYRIWHG